MKTKEELNALKEEVETEISQGQEEEIPKIKRK